MIDEGFNVDGVIGSVIAFLCLCIPFILFFLTYKYSDTVGENKSVSSLFDEFKSQKFSQMLFYPLFFLRRFTYMCGICFLKNYPVIQVANNASFSFIVFFYIVVTRPYKDCLKVVINSVNELFLGTVFIVTSLCLLDLSDDNISTMGIFLGIGTISVIGINGLMSILLMIQKLREKCKKKNSISVIDEKQGNIVADTVVVPTRSHFRKNEGFFFRERVIVLDDK